MEKISFMWVKKRKGRKFYSILIDREAQITLCRIENILETKKRAYPSIWDLRVYKRLNNKQLLHTLIKFLYFLTRFYIYFTIISDGKLYFFFSQILMELNDISRNPWAVETLDVYLHYCCPECDHKRYPSYIT